MLKYKTFYKYFVFYFHTKYLLHHLLLDVLNNAVFHEDHDEMVKIDHQAGVV